MRVGLCKKSEGGGVYTKNGEKEAKRISGALAFNWLAKVEKYTLKST